MTETFWVLPGSIQGADLASATDYVAGESPGNQVTTRGDKVARESAPLPDSNEA